MGPVDREVVGEAVRILERPGLAMRLADLVGKPVELGLKALPAKAQGLVLRASQGALTRALDVALWSLDEGAGPAKPPGDRAHRRLVTLTGAAGGFFGLPALAVELPLSTVVMLRSIAEHCRAQGEDFSTLEARMNCLVVFGLGGTSSADDAADLGYFAVRAGLARAVAEAAEYLASHAAAGVAAKRAAPALARLVAKLATRFGPAVMDKVAAQALPVAGAVGGAAINAVFIQHFQRTAWAHFTIRRLEREHGPELVRAEYDRARDALDR